MLLIFRLKNCKFFNVRFKTRYSMFNNLFRKISLGTAAPWRVVLISVWAESVIFFQRHDVPGMFTISYTNSNPKDEFVDEFVEG